MLISRSNNSLIPFLFLLMTIISVSPLWGAFSIINGNYVSVLTALVIFLIRGNYLYFDNKYLTWSFVVLFGAMFPTVYWLDYEFIFIPIYLISGFYVVSIMTIKDLLSFINLVTTFIFIMLAGAIVGVIYAYYGGESILDFGGLYGHSFKIYLTTLTPMYDANFIRPSSILSEPGALSFFICLVAALRNKVGAKKKTTWILLGLGFITISIAHLIYTIFHFLQEVKSSKGFSKKIKILFMLLAIIYLISLIPTFYDLLDRYLFQRFSSTNINELGQDRLIPFFNAIRQLDLSSFFFAKDSINTFNL